MSTATKLEYLNETKSKIKDNINLTGAGLTNQTPFRQYATDLKTALLNILNNGIDTLYNNFPKATGAGTNISLNNTLQAPIRSVINGDTEQDGTPTPTTPIEIQSVTGLQKVSVEGKNLFDYTQLPIKKISATETIIDNGIKVTDTVIGSSHSVIYKMFDVSNLVGTTFTIKANWVASGSNLGRISIGLCDENGDNRIQGAYNDTSNNSLSYTIPIITTPKYLAIWLYSNTNGTSVTNTTYVDYTNIQLEQGSTATEYEPYQSQEYEINLGTIKLNKIGNYQDYITGTPDNWSIKRQIGSVVLDGTNAYGGGTTGTNAYYLTTNITTFEDNAKALAYSNMFQSVSFTNRNNGLDVVYSQNGSLTLRTANNTSIDWNNGTNRTNWLNTNKPEILYVLATETTEPITNTELIEDLNNFYNAKSYNGQTNISVDGDLQMILDVSAIIDE